MRRLLIGEKSIKLTLFPIDDDIVEDDEHFYVNISRPVFYPRTGDRIHLCKYPDTKIVIRDEDSKYITCVCNMSG